MSCGERPPHSSIVAAGFSWPHRSTRSRSSTDWIAAAFTLRQRRASQTVPTSTAYVAAPMPQITWHRRQTVGVKYQLPKKQSGVLDSVSLSQFIPRAIHPQKTGNSTAHVNVKANFATPLHGSTNHHLAAVSLAPLSADRPIKKVTRKPTY